MTINYKSSRSITLIALMAVACGAGEAGTLIEDSETAQQQVLHSFEVAGVELTVSNFVGADGTEVVMMGERGSAYRSPLLPALLQQEPNVTSLEVYLALAGSKEAPHELLVAAHSEEAKAMGRSDVAVKQLSFQSDRTVSKVTAAACESHLVDFLINAVPRPATQLKHHRTSVSGFTYNCLGGSCANTTTHLTASIVCNDSNVTIQERNAWRFPGGSWNNTGFEDLGVGQYQMWFMHAGGTRYYSADGLSATGKLYHTGVGAVEAQVF